MNDRCAILFDLDGTLVDLNPDKSELELLRANILNHAKDLGITLRNTSIFDIYQSVLEQYGFQHPVAKEMRSDLDAFEIGCVRESAVLKCQKQNFEALHELSSGLGIVTSNGSACLQALFGKNGLEEKWFQITVTRDDCALLKPSASPLEQAIRLANGICPNLVEVWFVGDSPSDKQAVDNYNRSSVQTINFIKVASCYEIEGFPDHRIDDVLIDLSLGLKRDAEVKS